VLDLRRRRAKLFLDRYILRKEFFPGMKVVLYDSKLYPFLRKLRFCWTGLYVVYHVFPYGVVEIKDHEIGVKFKVNDPRSKQLLGLLSTKDVECEMLHEPGRNE